MKPSAAKRRTPIASARPALPRLCSAMTRRRSPLRLGLYCFSASHHFLRHMLDESRRRGARAAHWISRTSLDHPTRRSHGSIVGAWKYRFARAAGRAAAPVRELGYMLMNLEVSHSPAWSQGITPSPPAVALPVREDGQFRVLPRDVFAARATHSSCAGP